MKELIKEAEELYNQLNGIPMEIISNRTNKDPYSVNYYIRKMGDLTCKILPFLNKLIDRKDNIVDLGEVWHSVDEEPDGTRNILIDSSSYVCNTISPLLYDDGRWKHIVNKLNVRRWAYIENLLPKGGKK